MDLFPSTFIKTDIYTFPVQNHSLIFRMYINRYYIIVNLKLPRTIPWRTSHTHIRQETRGLDPSRSVISFSEEKPSYQRKAADEKTVINVFIASAAWWSCICEEEEEADDEDGRRYQQISYCLTAHSICSRCICNLLTIGGFFQQLRCEWLNHI